jgi:hypothetical protein
MKRFEIIGIACNDWCYRQFGNFVQYETKGIKEDDWTGKIIQYRDTKIKCLYDVGNGFYFKNIKNDGIYSNNEIIRCNGNNAFINEPTGNNQNIDCDLFHGLNTMYIKVKFYFSINMKKYHLVNRKSYKVSIINKDIIQIASPLYGLVLMNKEILKSEDGYYKIIVEAVDEK